MGLLVAPIIDVATGGHLWAERCDTEFCDLSGVLRAIGNVSLWPKASVRCVAVTCPESGVKQTYRHRSNDAIDPSATLAVHCGNGFDAGFSLYRSARLSR